MALREQHAFEADDVKSVRVIGPPLIKRLCGRPPISRRRTPNYARLCMPFVGAKVLLHGKIDLAHYRDAELTDPATHEMAQRITMEADGNPDPNALVPQQVVITLKDGSELRWRCDVMLANPARRLTREQHLTKFRRCLEFASRAAARRHWRHADRSGRPPRRTRRTSANLTETASELMHLRGELHEDVLGRCRRGAARREAPRWRKASFCSSPRTCRRGSTMTGRRCRPTRRRPASSISPSRYIYYPYGPANAEGVRTLDYSKYEGRLVERWEFDEPSLTWTFHLRKGVKSCAGNEFTADDVIYTFARAKSVSGKAPIGWFLANVGSIDGFTRDVFKPGADKSLGDAVVKVDDYTVKIKQSVPNRLFLMVMTIYATYPYDSKEMKKHATAADPWTHDYVNTVNVPAFGAYCLERWVKDDEFV